MRKCLEIAAVVMVVCVSAAPVLAWSCASDDTLAADVTAEERARISAEVARQRAEAEAVACAAEGRNDCADMSDLPKSVPIPAGG